MTSEEVTGDSPPTPSFKGQLKLHQFLCKDAATSPTSDSTGGGVRRSSRLSSPALSATSQSPAPSKRKALASPDDASPPSSASKRVRGNGNGSGSRSGSQSSSTANNNRGRTPARYAPPSTYAHLSHLTDSMGPDLLVMFVGLNPGVETARQQHAYAHPTNMFWRLLASSGTTPRLCSPSEDRSMPRLYHLGLTNIVSRPSRNGAELSKAEMDAGVSILEEKARRWRPEAMCIVGKGIWESIWRVRHGRPIKKTEFKYGWQDASENMGVVGKAGQKEEEKEEGVTYPEGAWKGARVFVATSTSGLAATLKPAEKEAIWREMGIWVEKRRAERLAAATAAAETTSAE